jgi:hypothetical protein
MHNEFLNGLRAKIDGVIASGVISQGALEAMRREVDRAPELQGSCGVCLREVDHMEADGRYVGTDPIEVRRCANECRGCSECVKPCADGACSLAICTDCSNVCEGCGDRFCSDHTIEDPDCAATWCSECLPSDKRRKLALMDKAESMRG